MKTFIKNFDFNLRRDHQKITYERRAYESEDKKNYLRLWRRKKKTRVVKG